LPIGDVRRNSYIQTARGQRSLKYLICLCRARALARARAVQLSFTTTLDHGKQLTLRHSASLSDPRLSLGGAIGKVVALSLSFDASSGVAKADVTLGCTIGEGNSISFGTPTGMLVAPGALEPGIQAVEGGATQVASDVGYSPIDAIPITSDLDLYDMTVESSVLDVVVTNSVGAQASLLLGTSPWDDTNAAVSALNEIPTRCAVQLEPVTGDAIVTPFPVTVTDLMVPKTIDLG
jgi:hypothetical protein